MMNDIRSSRRKDSVWVGSSNFKSKARYRLEDSHCFYIHECYVINDDEGISNITFNSVLLIFYYEYCYTIS